MNEMNETNEINEDFYEYHEANTNTKIGSYIVHNDRAHKIKDRAVSKTGKHGHMKIHVVLEDIFTLKKSELIVGSSDKIKVPKIKKIDYQLVCIDDDTFVTYVNAKGESFADINLPSNELGKEIKAKFESGTDMTITILSAMGQSCIINYAEDKN
jgi:translation initiation factor 5A